LLYEFGFDPALRSIITLWRSRNLHTVFQLSEWFIVGCQAGAVKLVALTR
jgi:hypothetical protein